MALISNVLNANGTQRNWKGLDHMKCMDGSGMLSGFGRAQPALPLSLCGLNLVNFFIAEVTGVIIPFLSDFLMQHGWHYGRIGFAAAAAGFGTLVFQTAAGVISDRIRARRLLLGFMSIVLGVCYVLVPLVTEQYLVLCCCFFYPVYAPLSSHRSCAMTLAISPWWGVPHYKFNHGGKPGRVTMRAI